MEARLPARSPLSRRAFLRLLAASAAGMAFRPPPQSFAAPQMARVAARWLTLHKEPSFRAPVTGRLVRDQLISLLQGIKADEGPRHNPLWYETQHGLVHSGDLQLVAWQIQLPQRTIRPTGQLFEVSVPYTRSRRRPDPAAPPLYRLYYQSTAWVVDCVQGADQRWWYKVFDELLRVHYYARAEHLRLIADEELAPLSPEVPLRAKKIQVDLAQQELRAFENGRLVLRTRISSGIPDPRPRENGIPTITPSGSFYVSRKMAMRHMGDGNLTADIFAYELPGVPWCSFFHQTGVAFHGTYWHSDFGRPRSHGCVNMRTEEARWIYRWCLPVVDPRKYIALGYGTRVEVF